MKKFKRIALLCILFALLYVVITAISIWRYGFCDEKKVSDAAIVLGAGASDRGVSAVYAERINHAIWLYNNGYVKFIILTGGMGEGNTRSDADIAGRYAMSKGVPEDAILLEEESKITQENIKNAKSIMQENLLNSAIIVSDPLHMKRAMLMAKDYDIKACSSPTPTTKYISLKTKIQFLLREEFFYIGYKLYRLSGVG